MYSNYLFDFDGTLVDSMPFWVQSMKQILIEDGITVPPDLIRIVTPLGNIGAADYYIEQLGVTCTRSKLIERMSSYAYKSYAEEITAKEGVAKTLQVLKQKGAHLHVLTASPHKTLDICLKRLDLWDYFDHVWSCDDFHTTKSDPSIYCMAARKIGCTLTDCVFLDDNINALRTAVTAGMPVIGVYDETSQEDYDQILSLCKRYARKLEDILSM